jgi:hypothetical protein
MKSGTILAVCLVVAMCSVGFAAEFWVIKDASGKLVIVEEKPADTAVIVKGPFVSRSEAEVIVGGPVARVEGKAEGRVETPPPAPGAKPVTPAPPAAPR